MTSIRMRGILALLGAFFVGLFMGSSEQGVLKNLIASGSAITIVVSDSSGRSKSKIDNKVNAAGAAITKDVLALSSSSSSNVNVNSDNKEPHLCYENPYCTSIKPPHTLETAKQKAEEWMASKSKIMEKVVAESNGETHKKFNGFHVMAPCDYECTGRCRDDTSKIVCGLAKLREAHDTKCIVYSIGGNNQWAFEENMYDMSPCEIHTFDCTGPITRFRVPSRIRDRVHFHHVCMSNENQPAPAVAAVQKIGNPIMGEMWTLEKMQQQLNHTRLDLLKMDIEGFEWPIFDSWPLLLDYEESSKVKLPMQVLVEVHYRTQMAALKRNGSTYFRDSEDLVNLAERLLKIGYVVAVRDDNMECASCTELTLLRHMCY